MVPQPKSEPGVRVTHDGETRRYVARDAEEDERKEYWRRADEAYVGFEGYRRRSGDRKIPIVVLEPK